MNETVIKLVDAIKTGDAVATEEAFAAAMAEKLASRIDDFRQQVSAKMFTPAEPQVQEEEFTEESDLAEIVENYTEEFDNDEITIEEEELKDLEEKYEGFKKLSGELAAKGAKNPKGLAAWIGRRKYGAEKFQAAAAKGEKMNEEEELDEGLGKVVAKVAKGTANAVGNVIGGVAKTAGAIRQTPAAIGSAYNRGRAAAQKSIDK